MYNHTGHRHLRNAPQGETSPRYPHQPSFFHKCLCLQRGLNSTVIVKEQGVGKHLPVGTDLKNTLTWTQHVSTPCPVSTFTTISKQHCHWSPKHWWHAYSMWASHFSVFSTQKASPRRAIDFSGAIFVLPFAGRKWNNGRRTARVTRPIPIWELRLGDFMEIFLSMGLCFIFSGQTCIWVFCSKTKAPVQACLHWEMGAEWDLI